MGGRAGHSGTVIPDNPRIVDARIDSTELLAALEHQIAVLAPIAARLHAAVVHPPIAPHDWQGPASRSYGAFEQQLRDLLRAADDAVGASLHSSRLARGQLGG
jgi:hypothetical protein